MPLSLLNHSALALFAQRTRIPTSARSIGFCAIWVCISSSSIKKDGTSKVQLVRTRSNQSSQGWLLVDFKSLVQSAKTNWIRQI